MNQAPFAIKATFGSYRGALKFSLEAMNRLRQTYSAHPHIRQIAAELVRGLPDRDYGAQADALYRYVRDNIRYIHDIDNVETIQTPLETLRVMGGDCDCQVVLLSALASSIGMVHRFAMISDGSDGTWTHIYVQFLVNGRWMDADPIAPHGQPFGQGPTSGQRRAFYEFD